MVADEATVIRWLLFVVAIGAVAYGLWWFLFRKPPRRQTTLFPVGNR